MAEITKQALKVENNTEFPNNNNGQIKPTNLRGFNEDMIDSLVDEIKYNVDSGSWNSSIQALNDYTASASGGVLPPGVVSGSSQIIGLGFATTGSNTFTGTQTINQSIVVGNPNGTIDFGANVIGGNLSVRPVVGADSITMRVESNALPLNISGFAGIKLFNRFGELNYGNGNYDIGTGQNGSWTGFSGSFGIFDTTNNKMLLSSTNQLTEIFQNTNISGALTASGLIYPSVDNGEKSFIQTDGNGNLSLQYVQTVYETIRNMSGGVLLKGTPVYISGSTGDNGNAYPADASDLLKMPAVFIAGENLNPGDTGLAVLGGKIEGVDTSPFIAGTIIYVGEGGGFTASRPSGSNSVVQVLGVVQKQGVGGQGVVINQLEALLPNIQTGYAWVGNGANQPIAIPTSSFGGGTGTGFPFSGSAEITGSLSVSETVKSQVYMNPQIIDGFTIPTGNNAVLVGPVGISGTVTVEGTSKLIVLDQVTGSAIDTSSLATTGSNIFNGDQTINGGLLVSSSTQPIGFSGSTFTVDTVGGIVFKPGTDMTFQGNTVFTNPGRFPLLNVDSATQTNGYYGFNNEVDGRIYQAFSGSVDTRLNTAATTTSNIFIGNQTITGSLLLSSSVDRVVINAPNYSTFGVSDIGGIDLNSSVTFRSDVRFNGAIRTAGQIELGKIIGTSASTLPGGGNQLNIITNLQIFDDSNVSNPKYVSISGSADVSQSLQVGEALKLKSNDPLPAGTIGDLAVSGSSLYFYNGAWTLVI